MKLKFLIIFTFFLTFTLGFGQNQKEATKVLKTIKEIEQVEEYKKNYSDWKIQLVKTMGIDSVKYPKAVNSEIGDIYTNSYDYPQKSNCKTIVTGFESKTNAKRRTNLLPK